MWWCQSQAGLKRFHRADITQVRAIHMQPQPALWMHPRAAGRAVTAISQRQSRRHGGVWSSGTLDEHAQHQRGRWAERHHPAGACVIACQVSVLFKERELRGRAGEADRCQRQ